MFAFDIATLLLFPGLGLVALAIGLLARRYSASALAAGLSGLLMATAASTWITTAGTIVDAGLVDRLKAENEALKQDAAELKTSLDAGRPTTLAPTKPDVSSTDRTPLEDELRAEQKRRAQADSKLSDALRREEAAIAKIGELEGAAQRERDGRETAERQMKLLEERMRIATTPPQPPVPQNPEAIRRTLMGESRFYTAQSERDLITGLNGSWYTVRLLRDGKVWSFADRAFVLADTTDIKTSALRLRDEILQPLSHAGKTWRMFVRGSADSRRVAGPAGREFPYLPLLPGGAHVDRSKGKRVAVPIQNEDLPILRADWLREVIRPVLGGISKSDIDILENPPASDRGRTAELVLFVEW